MDRIITFPETTLPLFLWKLVVNWRSRRGAGAHVYTISRKQARRGSLKQNNCNPTTAFRSVISCFGVVSRTVGLTATWTRCDATRRDARARLRRCTARAISRCSTAPLHCSNFCLLSSYFSSEIHWNYTHLRASRIQTQTNYSALNRKSRFIRFYRKCK